MFGPLRMTIIEYLSECSWVFKSKIHSVFQDIKLVDKLLLYFKWFPHNNILHQFCLNIIFDMIDNNPNSKVLAYLLFETSLIDTLIALSNASSVRFYFVDQATTDRSMIHANAGHLRRLALKIYGLLEKNSTVNEMVYE